VAWAKRISKTLPSIGSRTATFELNDYSEGMDSFRSNDKFVVKSGGVNRLRLAKNARIPTFGEYETRKGIDFYSDAAGETQDQAQTSVTGAADQSFGTTAWIAQKFTAGTTGRLSKLEVRLKNSAAATGNILVELWTDNAGTPGALVARSSIAASTPTSSYAYLTARFAEAPNLTSATAYWIVVHTQLPGSGSYKVSSTTTATTAKTSADSGTSWSATSFALNFKQHYATTGGVKGIHATKKSDGTEVTLFAHGTVLYSINESTGALTTVKSGLNANATHYRFVTVNDVVYYVNGYDGLRKWNFTTESQVNATNYVNICQHKGLLFLVDALDQAKVVFSNFADYETFTSTDFIYVPSPKTGDPVTAMQSLNGFLLIWTKGKKYILSGADNATFFLSPSPDLKGTYTQETTCADKNFAYYLSDDGAYRTNGSEAQLLSENNYEDVRTLDNKDNAIIATAHGRLYLWYPTAGSAFNSEAFVWNLNFSGESDTIESRDTRTYVGRASGVSREDRLLVASSLIGQLYWQELESNDFDSLGGDIDYALATHYNPYQSPAVLKEVRYWVPRFGAQDGAYSVACEYATDMRDNWQTREDLNVQGAGTLWGSGALWGAFSWGATSEVQTTLYVPGEYRRIALRYSHDAARQPNKFLGHTQVIQTRRIR
jgi:hypothetical protein